MVMTHFSKNYVMTGTTNNIATQMVDALGSRGSAWPNQQTNSQGRL